MFFLHNSFESLISSFVSQHWALPVLFYLAQTACLHFPGLPLVYPCAEHLKTTEKQTPTSSSLAG